MQPSKFQLRRQFREIRQHIPKEERELASLSASQIVKSTALFKAADKFACYLPFGDEFPTNALLETIWQAGKDCYLPVISEENDKLLVFVRYEYGDPLTFNRFKILEPKLKHNTIPARELDYVFTPLIAFDLLGHRLGTGGGFYDYTFAFRTQSQLPKPLLIGLGYEAQQAKHIPVDPWDIKLDGVLTEKEFILFD